MKKSKHASSFMEITRIALSGHDVLPLRLTLGIIKHIVKFWLIRSGKINLQFKCGEHHISTFNVKHTGDFSISWARIRINIFLASLSIAPRRDLTKSTQVTSISPRNRHSLLAANLDKTYSSFNETRHWRNLIDSDGVILVS